MIDSKKFLQFKSERSLNFKQQRKLIFDHDRSLLFDFRRKLLFDHLRKLPFGRHGPVFRGYACPRCDFLIHPIERECRSCGTRVRIVRKSELEERTAKGKTAHHGHASTVQAISLCPSCGAQIANDLKECPHCMANIPEWRTYLRDLRKWQEMVQGGESPQEGTRSHLSAGDSYNWRM